MRLDAPKAWRDRHRQMGCSNQRHKFISRLKSLPFVVRCVLGVGGCPLCCVEIGIELVPEGAQGQIFGFLCAIRKTQTSEHRTLSFSNMISRRNERRAVTYQRIGAFRSRIKR